LIPSASAVGLLAASGSPTENIELAARNLGLQLYTASASTEATVDAAFASLVAHRVAAVLVSADPVFFYMRGRILALASSASLPAVYEQRAYVADGGLMSYGASVADAYRLAGTYVARIIKGEKPADLPVLEPTKFELVINLKTAKALGLTIPPGVLSIADEVIE
jgi:putative ABC transport system substrate-binding protein